MGARVGDLLNVGEGVGDNVGDGVGPGVVGAGLGAGVGDGVGFMVGPGVSGTSVGPGVSGTSVGPGVSGTSVGVGVSGVRVGEGVSWTVGTGVAFGSPCSALLREAGDGLLLGVLCCPKVNAPRAAAISRHAGRQRAEGLRARMV